MNRVETLLRARLWDGRLEEVLGRGPRRNLVEGILAARRSGVPRRCGRAGRAALVLLAVGIVVAVASLGRPTRDAAQDPEVEPGVLVRRLADPDRRLEAEAQLLERGAAAVPALAAALDDERAPRQRVLDLLDRLGMDAAPALPAVTRLLERRPDPVTMRRLVRTAGTLVAYAEPEARVAANEAVCVAAFRDDRTPRGWTGSLERFLVRHRMADEGLDEEELLLLVEPGHDPYRQELAVEWMAATGKAESALTHARAIVRRSLDDAYDPWNSGSSSKYEWKASFGSGTVRSTPPSGFRRRDDTCARALVAFAGDRPRGALGHARLLIHGRPDERRTAALALGRYGVLPEDLALVTGALERALDSDDLVVLREAIVAVGLIDGAVEACAERIAALTEHGDPQVAARAGALLR